MIQGYSLIQGTGSLGMLVRPSESGALVSRSLRVFPISKANPGTFGMSCSSSFHTSKVLAFRLSESFSNRTDPGE